MRCGGRKSDIPAVVAVDRYGRRQICFGERRDIKKLLFWREKGRVDDTVKGLDYIVEKRGEAGSV